MSIKPSRLNSPRLGLIPVVDQIAKLLQSTAPRPAFVFIKG